MRQISAEIGEFSAAADPALIHSGPIALGMGICYEIIYPGLSRREVAAGANLLATISNDSWYGRAGAQDQHFAGAVFRSVDNSRYLLRAAITGVSGIVDPRGRIIALASADRRTTVFGAVQLRDERTAWSRWGFWIPRVSDVFAAAVLVLGLVRLCRQRRAERRQPTVFP